MVRLLQTNPPSRLASPLADFLGKQLGVPGNLSRSTSYAEKMKLSAACLEAAKKKGLVR